MRRADTITLTISPAALITSIFLAALLMLATAFRGSLEEKFHPAHAAPVEVSEPFSALFGNALRRFGLIDARIDTKTCHARLRYTDQIISAPLHCSSAFARPDGYIFLELDRDGKYNIRSNLFQKSDQRSLRETNLLLEQYARIIVVQGILNNNTEN